MYKFYYIFFFEGLLLYLKLLTNFRQLLCSLPLISNTLHFSEFINFLSLNTLDAEINQKRNSQIGFVHSHHSRFAMHGSQNKHQGFTLTPLQSLCFFSLSGLASFGLLNSCGFEKKKMRIFFPIFDCIILVFDELLTYRIRWDDDFNYYGYSSLDESKDDQGSR